MGLNINTQSASHVATGNTMIIPPEGPKCIPLFLDFSANAEYDINLWQVVSQTVISTIQTVYVDASAATVDTYINVGTSLQVIRAKAGTQGYYTVLATNPPTFAFTNSSGADKVNIYLINMPIQPSVWSV